jgi:uncharacterized protein YciI
MKEDNQVKKLSSYGIALMTATLLLTYCVVAQEKPDYDMGKMQMVFLTPVPDWKPRGANQAKQVIREQRKYVDALIASGKCALAGPATGNGQIREILVFKVESIEEVQTLSKSFPAIKAGMMTAETISWYAARNYIKTPSTPLKKSKYIFGLLVRGPKWTPEQTPETNKIQEGHMANINRLAGLGKLVLAGPFFDEGERRGVFIFKVNSLREAQTLTDTDPAVIAGRLKIELYHWTVPRGILK